MAFAWISLADKVKNAVFGFQSYNQLNNNLSYLKQQSEVLVAADGGTITSQVVTAASLKTSNVAVNGKSLYADSSVPGGLKWSRVQNDPMFWAMRG